MECLIGIKGKDFVLMASDTAVGRSVVSMKQGKYGKDASHTLHGSA